MVSKMSSKVSPSSRYSGRQEISDGKADPAGEVRVIAPLTASEENKQLHLLIAEEKEVLPAVARHFNSVWVFDHLLGFGDLNSAFLESWTALTWLATRSRTSWSGTWLWPWAGGSRR